MAIKNLILARGRLGGVAFIPTAGLTPSLVVAAVTAAGKGWTGEGSPDWQGEGKGHWQGDGKGQWDGRGKGHWKGGGFANWKGK